MPRHPSEPQGRRRREALRDAALAACVVLAGGVVFAHSLQYFFSQDDFAGLARAAGELPRLTGPWRYLSHQLVFDLLWRLADGNALPYHALGLLSHLTASVLLLRLLARRFAPPAAFAGSVFFATHPALYTAVYWFSAMGDSLALFFALAALLVLEQRGRLRWLSIPLFALSLLSKESTLLLPLVALAGFGAAPSSSLRVRARDPVILALGAVALADFAAFMIGNAFGVRSPEVASAYAISFGPHLAWNLLSYLGWSANFLLPITRSYQDAVDPEVFLFGLAAVTLWLGGALSRRLRSRGWLAGGAAFVLFLLPVLPLSHHTYHYYLYAPLAGAAWCLAAAFDAFLALFARSARGWNRSAWGLVAILAILLSTNGALLVHKIETHPFLIPELRADPVADRACIARRVIRALRAARLSRGDTLLFWSPVAHTLASTRSAGRGAEAESYFERNVRAALLDGLAVRVLVPEVSAVRFVDAFDPFVHHAQYAVYLPDGSLRVIAPVALDSLLRLHPLAR